MVNTINFKKCARGAKRRARNGKRKDFRGGIIMSPREEIFWNLALRFSSEN